MGKYKTLGLVVPFIFVSTLLFVDPHPRGQEQSLPTKSLAKRQKKTIDVNQFPIADFSNTEPIDAKRKDRGERRDKSKWAVSPDVVSDSTVIVDSVDTSLPAFPVGQASAVVSGVISDARAYLSNDRSGVYSSFNFIIDDVLKNSGDLKIGQTIEVEREGGRVKFPSGRVHLYMVAEQDMPHVGGHYVFFVSKTTQPSIFEIIIGYEIRGDSVYALDEVPQALAYEDSTATSFLQELRAKTVAKP